MLRSLILSVFIAFTGIACSEGNSTGVTEPAKVEVTHKELSGDAAKVVANLSIDGMTCAAGCGGKIQQDLRAMKGVVNTELDFEEGRASNIVSVEFDPAVISEKEMIQCVGSIGDGNYHVQSVEIVHYTISGESTGGTSSNVAVGNFGKIFQVLNLLQSVTRMIQG